MINAMSCIIIGLTTMQVTLMITLTVDSRSIYSKRRLRGGGIRCVTESSRPCLAHLVALPTSAGNDNDIANNTNKRMRVDMKGSMYTSAATNKRS
jgi:hypothetical protein